MEVQINLDRPFWYEAGHPVPEFPYRGHVMLATDPGKTNMAITIGTIFGVRLGIVQFRAGGYKNDNSAYCHDFKVFLTEYLKNCTVDVMAIEAAISKKGMNHHRSAMVLTEIRANLIDLSYSLTGKKAFEVNNWSWKYAVLPDGMRGQHEKGSTTFLPALYQQYGNADVTDSVCIYTYAFQKVGDPNYIIFPECVEEPIRTYDMVLAPKGTGAKLKARYFQYNRTLTLKQNLDAATNRTWEPVFMEVPTDVLSLEDVYGHARMFSPGCETGKLEVLALRSSQSGTT